MAKTTFATGNALTKKAWEEALYRDAKKDAYFNRFMGEGPENIVHVKNELQKGKGDKITFGIRMRLAGAGITGSEGRSLEGNEESLVTYSDDVTLEEYAHAVRDHGPLDRQRVLFSIDEESQNALKDWASEKIDKLCFDAVLSAPTKIFYSTSSGITSGTDVTTVADLMTVAYGKLTPSLISAIKANALTGGNRAYVPLRPVKVDGKRYLVLLIHPDVMYDLKLDATFTQALREAEVRGKENPLFNGAVAIWDGVVIHEHENVTVSTNATSIPYARCVLMGAQALAFAWGKRGSVRAEEFDYGREHGYGWDMICGTNKPVFNSLDYGSVGLIVARTNISGL